MSARETMDLDAFLAAQGESAGRLLATVETIDGDDERVRVTPYAARGGCLCDQALTVAKESIQSVAPTGEMHMCCGERREVVELAVSDATLEDVLGQLASATPRGNRFFKRRRGPGPGGPPEDVLTWNATAPPPPFPPHIVAAPAVGLPGPPGPGVPVGPGPHVIVLHIDPWYRGGSHPV